MSKNDVMSWLAEQHDAMIALTIAWAEINSGSYNPSGIKAVGEAVLKAFEPLAPEVEHINGSMRLTKRRDTSFRVLFGGHLDTVYPPDSSFQTVTWLDEERLQGPGVADMKGGIAIILKVIEAIEQSEFAAQWGWEVLLTPDEEIGSVGTRPLWEEAAKRNTLGLIFEPALPSGALVAGRKGSSLVKLHSKGVAAHSGRHFFEGESAIYPMAKVVTAIEKLIDEERGITVNVGEIHGGQAANVVPDACWCSLSIRALSDEAIEEVMGDIHEVARLHEIEVEEGSRRPAKRVDEKTKAMLAGFAAAGKELGIEVKWEDTGGVCDGNFTAAAGLPTIDTLGVRGGMCHSPDEFIWVKSLVERTQLTATFLMNEMERRHGTEGRSD